MKRWIAAAVLAALASPHTFAQEQPVLIVEEIVADSAAAKAGLAVGDRIASADGPALGSPAALLALEENAFHKPDLTLRVQRGEQTLVVTAPRGPLGMRVRPMLRPGALPLYEEGRHARAASQKDTVIARWSAAALAARDAGDAASAAWLYGRVAEIHEDERQWREASDAYATSLALWKQTSDAAAQSRTLVAMGRCSQSMNDFPAAIAWYEQAEKVDASAGNEMWVANDLAALGGVALSRGDLAAAQTYHLRALGIRDRLSPDSLEVAASVHALGDVAYTRGDLSAAQEYLSRALTIRERLASDSLDVAASLHSLGNVVYRRGDISAARDTYSRALSIRERLAPDSLDVAASLNNLGNLGVERGDLAAAESVYRRALDIRQRLAPGSLSVATTLSNLGVATHARGDLASAEAYYARSLAIREHLAPDSLDVASSLTNLGAVASDRGDVTTAEGYHRRALSIRERLAPDSLSLALSLFNLGNVSRHRGDPVAAGDYFRRSLRLREQVAPNSLSVAISLNHLGKVSRDTGALAEAQDYQSRALALHERLAPNSPYIAVTLNDLGLVAWSRGDLAGAQHYLGRALTLRERLAPNSLNVAESVNDLGGIALEQRRFDEALALFARAVDIVESRRWQARSADARSLMLAQHTKSYLGLMRAQLALNDIAAAFATAERSRARSLLEILTEARAEIRQGVDPGLFEHERSIQQQLNDKAYFRTQLLGGRHTPEEAARVEQELDALLVQYQGVQSEIRASSPRYAALMQPQPLGLAEIQRDVLDERTLLLEYVLGDERSHLFAVTPSSISSFVLPARGQIEQAARRVYESLIARQPVAGETASQRRIRIDRADADYPAAARALSQIVLQPAAAQLSGKRLLIVADGALQYIPFAALPQPGQTIEANAEPLVVKHEIINLPSASIVSVLRRERVARQPASRAVAVVADPVFDVEDSRLRRRKQSTQSVPARTPLPEDVTRAARAAGLTDDRGALARLAFTRDEADAIVALAPKGEGTRLVDFSASRATVTSPELGRYRIVHLATHGLLDAEHPELSGLVLSLVDEDGRPQDGFLRLHEVYNLSWSADLVVLSACQTALGKEIRGEGLVGLTRGFMYGGAERVIASVWNVNDSVTAQFMKRFYEGVFAKGLTPAAALRAAQVDMWRRQSSRSPYYWAAFVLQGEWR